MKVLTQTSPRTTSILLLLTSSIRRAIINFSDNLRALRDYKFEE